VIVGLPPSWLGWPPLFLPLGLRKLRLRGFFSPSSDGGFPLLLLFLASWSSSSCTLAASKIIISIRLLTRAMTAPSPWRVVARTSSSVGRCSGSMPYILTGFCYFDNVKYKRLYA